VVRKPIAWTLAAVALVTVLVIAIVIGVKSFSGSNTQGVKAECTVPVPGPGGANNPTSPTVAVPVYLEAVQLQNASTISAVGTARGLSVRARTIAIATAFQESTLRNLPGGDRDSVGLFQQRPSQGWGTIRQISDPVYAAGKFYDALLEVPNWQRLSLTKAAQAVQYSAFPDAYTKWEGQAATLAAALGGEEPVTLSCAAGARAPTAALPERKALPGTAAASPALATALAVAQAELGGLKVVSVTGSTAVLTETARNVDAAQAGRTLAAWAVAHATGFGITSVSVEGRLWRQNAWTSPTTALPPGQVWLSTS